MSASHLLPLLPIRGVRLRFRFTEPARLRFFHQPLVKGLINHLMDGALNDEPRLWIETPESGRVPFAKGDSYAFHVWCCNGAAQLLQTLVDRLRRLPDGLPSAAHRLPLGANLRFSQAADALTGERFEGVSRLNAYDAATFARELDFYLDQPPESLLLLSPARLLRPKQKGPQPKNEARYIHDRGELRGELLANRLEDSLNALLGTVGAAAPPRGAAMFQVSDDDIGWYDTAYYDADGDSNPMGGIVGRIAIEIIDQAALPALVLGQYTGIGQRRTFGWGRYRLETASGQGTQLPRQPARGVLSRAADPANIELAYRSVRARSVGKRPPDADRDPFDEDISALAWAEHTASVDDLLDEVTSALRAAGGSPQQLDTDPGSGSHNPDQTARDDASDTKTPGAVRLPRPHAEPLRGWILQKEGKAPRPLAVPTFAERVAQRAVLQILRADFDPLLSASSYGYRRGISRTDARDRLQALYREGYEWLYEADIEDFFDSVPHIRLATRLRSLLPDDPVVEQLMAWMAAPVTFRGEQIDRPAGLPQGAPLSPLLANLMLDDFDADLESMGFRLVRFADDFVVACRSREEAEAAALRVRQSLAEIDLRINEDKSGITHFDRGFRFLGYTFLRELAVDNARAPRHVDGPLHLEDLPPESWLARLARRIPHILDGPPITFEPAAGTPPKQQDSSRPTLPQTASEATLSLPGRLALREPSSDEPCSLLVATEGSLLSVSNGRLRVATPDGRIHEQPLRILAAVLLLGRQRLTGPTLTTALEAGVPIHFATRGGRYQGVLANNRPGPAGVGLWLRQAQRFGDVGFVLPLVRELVTARIHNQAEVLRQRARTEPDLEHAIDRLRGLGAKVSRASSRAELNGIEGAAAREFFQSLTRILPEEFAFTGRHRRPPPDPVNALLSLGYTMLYQRADTVLRAAGLLPEQGFYHQGHGRHAPLASDLMECFRHLVERQTLSMINRGELKTTDFLNDNALGCRLSRPAMARYLSSLSSRFITPMEDSTSGAHGSLYDHLWRLTRELIDLIDGRAGRLQAFRVK